jgi:hypothetical protein
VVTEARYFEHVKRRVQAQVHVDVTSQGLDPEKLVDLARDRIDKDRRDAEAHEDPENLWDRVYVVTDVDDFAPAIKRLQDDPTSLEGIDLVVSNPCFEVWLVCHTDETPKADRREVKTQAKRLGLVTGRNDKKPVMERLSESAGAERVAKQLRDRHHRCGTGFPDDAPSTHVDVVLRFLRDA